MVEQEQDSAELQTYEKNLRCSKDTLHVSAQFPS